MSLNHGLEAYKQTESNYVKGIDSAHGRIKLVFDIIINNYPEASFIAECKIEIADIYYKEWKYELAKETFVEIIIYEII